MYARIIAIVCLATTPLVSIIATKTSTKFAFVTPSIQRQQSNHVANPLMHHLTYKSLSFVSREKSQVFMFAQPSSSVSIENTNQSDCSLMDSQYHSSLSSDDDFVAMMTSKALEDEEDPLFLSYSTMTTPSSPESQKITKNEENTPTIYSDVAYSSTQSAAIPDMKQQDQPTVFRNALEPHIYHFNKALIDTVYNIICTLYPSANTDDVSTKNVNSSNDKLTNDKQISPRSYARFYVLETVARVPYFAYLSVLHLRETLGERTYSSGGTGSTMGNGEREVNNRRIRTHYAEADNELHHLLIMESLGGNTNPIDRAVAHCMALGYYWYVVLVYTMISPQAAYHLSEVIENHAYHTYDDFLNAYENELKQLPVPSIAKQYYLDDNSYLMDLCRTTSSNDEENAHIGVSRPKPILNSLYDVFVCVRNDEKEHWKTLCQLVQYDHMSAVHTTVNDITMIAPIQSTQPKPL